MYGWSWLKTAHSPGGGKPRQNGGTPSSLSSPHGSLSMHASTASLHPSPRISFRAACDRASAALMPPFVASFTSDMDACMPPGSRKPAG